MISRTVPTVDLSVWREHMRVNPKRFDSIRERFILGRRRDDGRGAVRRCDLDVVEACLVEAVAEGDDVVSTPWRLVPTPNPNGNTHDKHTVLSFQVA